MHISGKDKIFPLNISNPSLLRSCFLPRPVPRSENPENDKWYTSTLQLSRSVGDGHCLLHSLEPGCDVVRLRQDIVATLREEAALNVEFMDSYNEEADWLEADPDLWGGQLTMVAFSRLRAVKVLVHNSRDLDEILYDNSHPDISAIST